MTAKLTHAEAAYVALQIRAAQKRLQMVNVDLSKRGYDDPRLKAESELLGLQIASLRRELEGQG